MLGRRRGPAGRDGNGGVNSLVGEGNSIVKVHSTVKFKFYQIKLSLNVKDAWLFSGSVNFVRDCQLMKKLRRTSNSVSLKIFNSITTGWLSMKLIWQRRALEMKKQLLVNNGFSSRLARASVIRDRIISSNERKCVSSCVFWQFVVQAPPAPSTLPAPPLHTVWCELLQLISVTVKQC